MAGYTRQSAAQIITGATIQASHFNNEYNQLAAAFDGSTGHSHDGSAGNSPPIDLATGTTGTVPLARGGTGNATGSTLRFQVNSVDTNAASRLKLNFLNGVTAVDNPGNNSVDVTVLPTGGGVSSLTEVNTTNSLQGGGNLTTNRTLSLVGDVASPGNNKAYATDGSGVRGWVDRVLTTTTITGTNSLIGGGDLSANRTISLVNDLASPGNYKVYSTGSSGVRGWADVPQVTPSTNLGSGSGSRSLDQSLGSYFSATVSGTTTWSFTNVPATGNGYGFALELTNGGSAAQTWPAAVAWDGGTAPTLQSSGVDILGFLTRDGGTTWRGFRVWKAA